MSGTATRVGSTNMKTKYMIPTQQIYPEIYSVWGQKWFKLRHISVRETNLNYVCIIREYPTNSKNFDSEVCHMHNTHNIFIKINIQTQQILFKKKYNIEN